MGKVKTEPFAFLDRHVPVCSMLRHTIVVPTHNAAHHIATTIESLLSQRNARFEVIFIDGESRDRTLEIIRSFEDSRFRIQSAPTSQYYEMVNRGVAMAQGEYVQILNPGDSYLYPDALNMASWQIAKNDFPDLFYTASILRDEWAESHFFFRPLKKEFLRKGMQPTHLNSLWVKRETFKKMGSFPIDYDLRGALDFFIRFSKHRELLASSEMRVYIESAPYIADTGYLLKNFKETFQLIVHHYGFFWALSYLFVQKDLKRLCRHYIKKIRSSFQGR